MAAMSLVIVTEDSSREPMVLVVLTSFLLQAILSCRSSEGSWQWYGYE